MFQKNVNFLKLSNFVCDISSVVYEVFKMSVLLTCDIIEHQTVTLSLCNSFSSLRENRRSVGQNRRILEMSGEFCQFAGQCVRRKNNQEKCPDGNFGWLGL